MATSVGVTFHAKSGAAVGARCFTDGGPSVVPGV